MGNLNSAYDEIAAKKPKHVKDLYNLDPLMEQILQEPERNGGFSQRELYAEAIHKVLTLCGPKIAWNRSVEAFMGKKIPPASYFHVFQSLVTPFQWAIGWGLKILIFIPQWIGNKCLQLGSKLALNHTSIVEHYMDQKMEETEANTATSFAIQTMLYHQMQNALTLLHQKFKQPTSAEPQLLRKKAHLRGLVKHILDVINKGVCDTLPELKRLCKEKKLSFREWSSLEAEKNVRPEIVEHTMTALAIRLEAVTRESELKTMLYDLLQITNDSFTPQKPPPERDFMALQGAITELNDKMIETVVRHAIDTQLDFTNQKQIEELKNYLETFKQRIHTFYNDLATICRKLERSPTLSARETKEKVRKLLRHSENFHQACSNALHEVYSQNSHCNADTVAQLNAMNKALTTHCAPIVDTLNQMYQSADRMFKHDTMSRLCEEAQDTIRNIWNTLKNPITQQKALETCTKKIKTLENLITPFAEHKAIHSRFVPYCKQLRTIIETLSDQRSLYRILKQLEQQIALVPRKGKRSSTEAQCMQTIAQLPSKYHDTLREALNQCVLGKSSYQAVISIIHHLQKALEEKAEKCIRKPDPATQDLIAKLETLKQQKNTYLQRNQGHLKTYLRSLPKHSNQMLKWTDQQEGPTLWNILLFDTAWIAESLKAFAINRGQEKSRAAIESLFHKYNNSFFLNQLILLPLIQSERL